MWLGLHSWTSDADEQKFHTLSAGQLKELFRTGAVSFYVKGEEKKATVETKIKDVPDGSVLRFGKRVYYHVFNAVNESEGTLFQWLKDSEKDPVEGLLRGRK